MRPRRLLWQIYPTYLAVIVLTLAALTWFFSGTLQDFYYAQSAESLQARAVMLRQQVRGDLAAAGLSDLQRLCRTLGDQTGTRFTLILPSGRVVGDSREDPARMVNHASRPEVRTALEGGTGSSSRFRSTLGRNMMYVAVPVVVAGEITGVARAAMAVDAIDRALDEIHLQIVLAGIVVALVLALLSLYLSRRLSRPLEEMTRGAQRFARGELDERLTADGSAEIEALAAAMNEMAAQLDERLRTVRDQRNEQEAVLASMVEGVLAVDTEERILRLNRAAEELLGVSGEEVLGRRIQEVVRKADLQRFIARALSSRRPVEGDILIHDRRERYLQAHGTQLKGARGQDLGALIVLNDVSRLRRLENVRRDFVANVSHELKTPITAIKGCVETLIDGVPGMPDAGRRFLDIIARQGERLDAIIDDLLALSRIEQNAEREAVTLREESLHGVLRAALQSCSVNAEQHGVDLALDSAGDVVARVNSALLEQAVVNLINNAVRYSPEGSRVEVSCGARQDQAWIAVRDRGCGIAREHLPRLFERFYRVDRARSRKAGGTGLGLAIVKHIVQAHGGRVTVDSRPGEGSTFTIHLPAAR